MIFARRAIQRRLDELRSTVGDGAVDGLAHRLNKPGADRVAAMWEVIVLHALSGLGNIRYEVPLVSGKEPDIEFNSNLLRLTADVVCVSDEGIHSNNPYRELSQAIEKAKTKLGLPIGGVELLVQSRRTITRRGSKVVLRLPPRGRLQEFVDNEIVKQMREQLSEGERVLRIAIDDDEAGIGITIDPDRAPYSTSSFAAFDLPGIKDQNPLYGGLRRKADQLRAADGLTGIIVGDGDCRAMAGNRLMRDEISAADIVREFFRQRSSIDFVVLVTAIGTDRSVLIRSPNYQIRHELHIRDGCEQSREIKAVFAQMVERLPKPIMTPVNGAMRAREKGYDLGHHGGYKMSGRTITVSLRELTEVLAGLRTFEDRGAKNVEAARRIGDRGRPDERQPHFRRLLAQGRLPITMKVIEGDENDSDGWVEIEFGDPDRAISPFR